MTAHIQRPSYADSKPIVSWTFSLLTGYLNSPAACPSETAIAISGLYCPYMTQLSFLFAIGFLWGTIFHIAAQLDPESPYHAKLLNFLEYLRKQPPLVGTGLEEFEDLSLGEGFWVWLPYWRAVWADLENEAPLAAAMKERLRHRFTRRTVSVPGPWRGRQLSAEEWRNLHAFLAKGYMISDIPLLDVRGLSALLDALEEIHEDPTTVDNLVPAAAVWIIYAGEKLKGNHVEYGEYVHDWGTMRLPWSAGSLWKGKRSFNNERWDFWKDRFSDLRWRVDTQDETRKWAEKAYVRMTEIDQTFSVER